MNETLIILFTNIVTLIASGGGMFVYLNTKQKIKQEMHTSTVEEWKTLYDEMKNRLDEQEKENIELRDEIHELKKNVNNLTIELQNYKKYDSYINELEKYIEHLLHTIKSLVTEDAYKNLYIKQPKKSTNTNISIR